MTRNVRYLSRGDGRIAYTDRGTGPLVVLVPGMGDTAEVYRDTASELLAAGYRVVATELRGHGASDTAFRAHGDLATAGDLEALLDELGTPAVIVGNSFSGSAAVIAAARRPDAVAGLVLLSPFLRESASPAAQRATRLLFRVLFARPWGARTWASYYRGTLNKGRTAPWLGEHVAVLRETLSDAAHLAQFRSLATALDHREVEPFVSRVVAPSLVIVGALDPDYRDPAAELTAMGAALGAETELVPEAAHYAQAQRPDLVGPRILSFLGGLRDGAGWAGRA